MLVKPTKAEVVAAALLKTARREAVQHFNNGGSVVVRTRGHNVLYAKRWHSVGHTEAVLTSAIQESDSFNCVGGVLC